MCHQEVHQNEHHNMRTLPKCNSIIISCAKNDIMVKPQGDDVIPYDDDVPISREFCRSAIPSFFATIAFFLSWIGSLGCEFMQFNVLTTDYDNTTMEPIIVHLGIWYRQSVEFYNYTESEDGEGGYYTVSTCTDYSDNVDIDPSWMAARAFSVIVLILGGVALLLALATCCCLDQKYALEVDRLNGGFYLLTMLFQGLTLLILSSNLCRSNEDIRQMMGLDNMIYGIPDKCSLSEGAKCIISATVFWFLAGILSCYSFRHERKKVEASLVNTYSYVEPLLSP